MPLTPAAVGDLLSIDNNLGAKIEAIRAAVPKEQVPQINDLLRRAMLRKALTESGVSAPNRVGEVTFNEGALKRSLDNLTRNSAFMNLLTEEQKRVVNILQANLAEEAGLSNSAKRTVMAVYYLLTGGQGAGFGTEIGKMIRGDFGMTVGELIQKLDYPPKIPESSVGSIVRGVVTGTTQGTANRKEPVRIDIDLSKTK
jgi:hypothetical protein